jgi:hypothetical protein
VLFFGFVRCASVRNSAAMSLHEGVPARIAPTKLMPELAELPARLRRNGIDIPAFVREAEKLSDDDWGKLSALIMQWFAQETKGLRARRKS